MSEQTWIEGTEPKTNKVIEAKLRTHLEACAEARAAASRKRSTHQSLMDAMILEGVEAHAYRDAAGKKKMLRAKTVRKASISTVKEPRAPKRGRRGGGWSEARLAGEHAAAPPVTNGVNAKLAAQAEASARDAAPKKKRKAKR